MAQQTTHSNFEAYHPTDQIDVDMSQHTAQHIPETSYRARHNQADSLFGQSYDGNGLIEEVRAESIDINIDPTLRDPGVIGMFGMWVPESDYIPDMQDLSQDISNDQSLGGGDPGLQQDWSQLPQYFSSEQSLAAPMDFEDNMNIGIENSQPLYSAESVHGNETPYHASAISPAWLMNRPYTPPSSSSGRLLGHQSDGMGATVLGMQGDGNLPQLESGISKPQTCGSVARCSMPDDGNPTPPSTVSAQTLVDSPLYSKTPSRLCTDPAIGVSMSMLNLNAIAPQQQPINVQHWREHNRNNIYQGQTLQPPRPRRQPRSAPASTVQSQTSYACDVCGSTFQNKQGLQHHKRYHGNRPYSCVECVASFILKKDLKRHVGSVHRQEASFPCRFEDCKHHEQAFKRKDNWKRHMSTIHTWIFPPSRHASNASRRSRQNA